jgi:hypothetical protein
MPAQTQTTAKPCGCGCGCGGGGGTKTCCCNLTCFERPQYYCGHLLTDADLTLEQNYFREKNKLYHRAMDGFGVACGLRITCDPKCNGSIRIGKGYAIDPCGNDLVVCAPIIYPVIDELRKKNWITPPASKPCRKDDKEHDQDKDDCRIKQCFYLSICYDEQPADYVTPFNTGCSPGPAACQPTRVKEGVRFELHQEPPKRPNPLDCIEAQIEDCFRIFRDTTTFGKGLKLLAPSILAILTNDRLGLTMDPHDVCCQLRGLFLQQLRVCPDLYNCNLECEVSKIQCPPRDQENSLAVAAIALKKLFVLIERYVFGCILGQLAFDCPEPCGGCVLIGAVEVENGCLTRVVNWPRWYLWSFANLFEVLIATLINDAACSLEPAKDGGCCPNFDDDLEGFVRQFHVNPRATEFAARSIPRTVRALHQAMVSGGDFMSRGGVSPAIFSGMKTEEATAAARSLSLKWEVLGDSPASEFDPLSAILSQLMHRGAQPLGLFTADQGSTISAATRTMNSPAREPAASQVQPSIDDLLKRVKALEDAAKNPPAHESGGGNQGGVQ